MDIETKRKQILENNEKYREAHSAQNKFKNIIEKISNNIRIIMKEIRIPKRNIRKNIIKKIKKQY